jgi:molybdate transport system substrate-binding protein
VLSVVESGDADAGIVYATDAAISQQIAVVATADGARHDPITYPLALLQAAPQPEAAQTFVDYLLSDSAQATFQKFGFTPAN